MQTVHTAGQRLRDQRVPRSRAGGFTLIELMVTVTILAVAGAVAFAGFRQNEYRNVHRRFVEDVRGALLTARNFAIDEQTQVRATITSTEVFVTAFDAETNLSRPIAQADLGDGRSEIIGRGARVCIYGLLSGVQTPAQAQDQPPLTDCLPGTQVLQFDADGTFSDPDDTFTTLENAGATLWIADRQVTGQPKLSIVQVFPGGLIRVFNHLEEGP